MLRTSWSLILVFMVGLLLSSCSNSPQSTVSPTASVTQPPAETSTAAPPPTDTPVPARLLLIASTGSDAGILESARSTTSAAAAAAGIQFEERASLSPADLTLDIRSVVFLAPPEDLAGLLSAAPAAQFVVVSAINLPSAANLTVLRLQVSHQAFLAGTIAVLLSDDWRAAGLIPAETPELQQAFQNGGRYFCGTCTPGWPLGLAFPLIGSVPAADSAGWLVSANDLFDNGKAEVFYLSQAASTPEVLAYLAGRSQFETPISLVGTGTPPAGLEAQWAASVGFDITGALGQVLPGALAGQPSGAVNVPVLVTEVNSGLLSQGRLNLVNSALADLAAGLLVPESFPPE